MTLPKQYPDLDPMRLCCAAHELGHALVWRAGDFRLASIHVRGHGSGVHGDTTLLRPTVRTPEQGRLYLAGLLAGGVAGAHWAAVRGIRQPAAACRYDEAAYRRNAKRLAPDLSRAEVLRTARHQLRMAWEQLERLTPQLAANGYAKLKL